MDQITSLQNEYVKSLVKLNSASGRRDSGLFIIEGKKLCEEAILSGWDVEKCLIVNEQDFANIIAPIRDRTVLISDHIAKKITSMETPPGIFMVLRQKKLSPIQPTRFILALDHVSDPTNLGAILRSAEAFGTDHVFLSEGCVDLYSPKVLRSAMGSAFRVPVCRGDLSQFITEQKKKGYAILGAGLNKNYALLPDVSFEHSTVIVIGNESKGISDEIMALCDQGLYIPMLGKNESLNAAVAASIILWEQSKWK